MQNQTFLNQRELFEAAIAIAPEQRSAWLLEHCPDIDTRFAVERLLRADADARVLDRSIDDVLQIVGDAGLAVPPFGATIGPFRLLDQLGEGGSSIVFRASREQAGVSQHVALKLLRRNLYTEHEQRRFRDERRALSQLQHPGIARLIEGGVTDSGTPYIALELIDGVSIVDYVRDRELDLGARLRLFIAVCGAVEAAHRALIVHRDLKPANVLVTADGHVKLLDFGIAKLLDARLDGDPTHTQQQAMTPAYAAPEQFRDGPITTATDVYSLGVLLGELISGQRREPGDTRTPSSRVASNTGPGVLPAPAARTRRLLSGDLDNIVLQASAEEPEHRYSSAGALAADIERHLANQPVAAHPPSAWYRTRKFIVRHRGGVVTGAAFAVAILAALGLAVWQAQVAIAEARRAEAMRDFMVSSFREAQPGSPRDGPPRITEVVEAAVARARSDASMPAAVRVELLTELGGVLREQGRIEVARETLHWNYDQARRHVGETARLSLSAGVELLRTQLLGKDDVATRLLADNLLAQIPLNQPRLRSGVLAVSSALAVRQRDSARALADGLEAVQLARRADIETLAESLSGYSQTLFASGDSTGAAAASEEQLALRVRQLGARHVAVATAHANLSRIYRRAGDIAAAERHVRAALEIDSAVLPADDWRRARHLNALMMVKRQQRDFAAALDAALESLRINRIVYGPAHAYIANDMHAIGKLRLQRDDAVGSVEPLRESLAMYEALFGARHFETASTRASYGQALAKSGEVAAGAAALRRALADLAADAQPDFDEQAGAWEKLARLQLERGEPESALAEVDALDAALAKLDKPRSEWRGRAATLRANALLQKGDALQATTLLATARSYQDAAAADADVELHVEIALLQAIAARRSVGDTGAGQLRTEAMKAFAELLEPPSWLRQLAATVEEETQ